MNLIILITQSLRLTLHCSCTVWITNEKLLFLTHPVYIYDLWWAERTSMTIDRGGINPVQYNNIYTSAIYEWDSQVSCRPAINEGEASVWLICMLMYIVSAFIAVRIISPGRISPARLLQPWAFLMENFGYKT